MASDYSNAAWFYDNLSRVVFGQALVRAQTRFLSAIPAGANVLIAGGGTGKLLESIAAVHPQRLKITYAEISSKMIARARQRNAGQNEVTFVNDAVEHVAGQEVFDVVITPFLLDSLNPVIFPQVFNHMHQLLKPGGIWLNTDFQLTGKWWQKPLLKSMYFFFRLMGCTDTISLPQIANQFRQLDYDVVKEKGFYGDFILASVYEKQKIVI
ncbi:methyltransferase family protein [Mucilaginibacter yixingensis]|uniref:Methyltransferase family protein n=1 Tax=Mucilaginibacter yixingensis TaxID=1295612 RepID=A0A2T5J709_9SPHI|nr:class I SAM-dependent methyltransferase [Mucilaginibacter yixingensis]PTQ94948.1 methyltransferase family protein [Mucilaginibacter yixingensis]